MPQNQEIQKNNKGQKPEFELDPETIKAIVAQQSRKLEVEAQKLRLEEKRLEQDGKLAEKSMELNSRIIKDYPAENRKTILTIGGIICFVIVLLLSFILYCINQGKAEFADKFLNWLGHIVGIAGGFFVGKLSNKKKQPGEPVNEPEDAQVID